MQARTLPEENCPFTFGSTYLSLFLFFIIFKVLLDLSAVSITSCTSSSSLLALLLKSIP
jgi:hypothetical protein